MDLVEDRDYHKSSFVTKTIMSVTHVRRCGYCWWTSMEIQQVIYGI